MTYRFAKTLHNEDEVTVKKTGVVLRVVEVEVFKDPRAVTILCDDGERYSHLELK